MKVSFETSMYTQRRRVTSQKMWIFIYTTARTSNLAGPSVRLPAFRGERTSNANNKCDWKIMIRVTFQPFVCVCVCFWERERGGGVSFNDAVSGLDHSVSSDRIKYGLSHGGNTATGENRRTRARKPVPAPPCRPQILSGYGMNNIVYTNVSPSRLEFLCAALWWIQTLQPVGNDDPYKFAYAFGRQRRAYVHTQKQICFSGRRHIIWW